MSAFMLLAANASANLPYQQQFKQQRRKKKPSSSRSLTSSGSLQRYNTYASLHSSSSSERKKVYDVNKSKYVDREETLAPAQKKIQDLKHTYSKAVSNSKYRTMNTKLNDTMLSEVDESLFTMKNLNLLRYSYFKQFNSDYDLILCEMNETRKVDDKPRLGFVRKIDSIKQRKCQISSDSIKDSMMIPSLRESMATSEDDEKEEESADDASLNEDDEIARFAKSILISNNDSESIEKIYQEYSTFKTNVDKGAQLNIRSLLKSNQFWNNVYQDVKFNYIQLKSTINYFDLLPNVNHSIQFFGELTDFFLYNIQSLAIDDFSGVTKQEDIEKLKQQAYFYFEDSDYDFLISMSKSHHKNYFNQSMMNVSLSSPISTTFSMDKSDMHDLRVHKDLMDKLLDTIVDNLKSSLNLPNKRFQQSHNESLFTLWREFLNFMIFQIIVQESTFEALAQEDEYPEPTIDNEYPEPTIDELKDLNNFQFTSPPQITKQTLFYPQPQNRAPPPPLELRKPSIKLKRNASISSRSTTVSNTPSNASIMSSPLQHKASFASSISSTGHSYNYSKSRHMDDLDDYEYGLPQTPVIAESPLQATKSPSPRTSRTRSTLETSRPSSPLSTKSRILIFSKFRK